jgi:Na+/H+-dicarboxylate symporter
MPESQQGIMLGDAMGGVRERRLALVLAIGQILDMDRTMTNVIGNSLATA